MTLVVEDDTGLENANSYVDVDFVDAYFTERGNAAWTGSDAVKEAAIIRAMDYVETRWTFLGIPEFPETPQALQWPRLYVFNEKTMTYYDGVPLNLKRAVAEYALRALAGELAPDPTTTETGQVLKSLREKVGPLETETVYQDGGQTGSVVAGLKPYPAADMLLRGLVRPTNHVVRA